MFIYWVFKRRDKTFPDIGLCSNNYFSNALFAIIHCVWSPENFWHHPEKNYWRRRKWVDTVLGKYFFIKEHWSYLMDNRTSGVKDLAYKNAHCIVLFDKADN